MRTRTDLHIIQHCKRLIFRYCHHRIKNMVFRIRSQPVKVPFMKYRAKFPIFCKLLRNLRPFFSRQLSEIQLVAKAARKGNPPAGAKRRYTLVGVARAGRHMCAHCRAGIYQSRPFLDCQAVNGFRIVRSPNLRAVVKHPRIKAPATTATVFQQDVRKIRQQAFLQFVNTEHIAMRRFPLLVCG